MKADIKNESHRVSIGVYKPMIQRIQKAACDYYGVDVKVSQQHTRKDESMRVRQVIHYLCRELYPNCFLHIIGTLTGNGRPFDHSTVINSHRVISNDLNSRTAKGNITYPELHAAIKEIRLLISSRSSNRKNRIRMHYRLMFKRSRKFSFVTK